MEAPKLLSGGTKSDKLLFRGIFVVIAVLTISLCSIFLLRALTPEAEPVRGIKPYQTDEYKIPQVTMKPRASGDRNLNAENMILLDITKIASPGKNALEMPPKSEPGGRVIGRGRNIQGVIRLVRVQHDLADWWADQSSLVALTEWLNTQTRIKADL